MPKRGIVAAKQKNREGREGGEVQRVEHAADDAKVAESQKGNDSDSLAKERETNGDECLDTSKRGGGCALPLLSA